MNELVRTLLVVSKAVFAVFLGTVATVCLLYIMQALIERGELVIKKVENIQIVDLIRVKEERYLLVKSRKAEKPPEPDELPTLPQQDVMHVAQASLGFHLGNLALNPEMQIGPVRYADADRDYLPIVKVMPNYPQRAAAKSIVGWVLVEFTVTSKGTVSNPVVIDNCAIISLHAAEVPCEDLPNAIFDQAALKAALKFKYVPKTIDGVAIATIGVQNLFTFRFEE
jgi:protein TonB